MLQDKIKFEDDFGETAQKPLQERYEAGELNGAPAPVCMHMHVGKGCTRSAKW